MAYSPYKMKGSEFYGGTNGKAAPKFLGKLVKGIGGMAKKAVVGSDGKFGIGDVGRMALGPMGMLGGALSYKDKMAKKTKETLAKQTPNLKEAIKKTKAPTQKRGCKSKKY
tara:strand:+ start:623 stop:955 length:333 start_codon:yes stop_codon:yes gene_type:complete